MTCGAQLGAPEVCGGALRPENLVVARSNAPQNRWTGLAFPTNVVRKRLNTLVVEISRRQNRST